jgi:hypothetical protein
MIVVLAAGALLAAATPPQPAKAEKDPLVCKSETPVGTRLPQRVCVRKSERERQQRESRTSLEDVQTRSKGPVKTGN